jgi:hypothetical protein
MFEYSSVSTHNLVSYHVYLTALDAGEDADSVVQGIYNKAALNNSYKEKWSCIKSESMDYLMSHKFNWMKMWAKGIVLMVVDPGRFDIDFFLNGNIVVGGRYMEMLNKEGALAVLSDLWNTYNVFLLLLCLIPIVNCYLLVQFGRFLLDKEFDVWFRLIAFILVGGIFVATGPIGASRFRMPLLLSLILIERLVVARRSKSIV